MADPCLTVQMEGQPEDDAEVRFDSFVNFLAEVRHVLAETERHLSQADPFTYYTIAGLSAEHRATVTVRARRPPKAVELQRPDIREPVLTSVVGGYRAITEGRTPEGFDLDLMLEFAQLAKHFPSEKRPERGIGHAILSHGDATVGLSPELRMQVGRVLGPDIREHGEVSGMLDAVHLRGKRYFMLYPISGYQKKIRCFFPPELQGAVGDAVKRTHQRYVTVSGVLRYKASSFQPYAVNAHDVRVHPLDETLPSLRDLRGIAPSATGNMRSEDFVRRLRDGWR